jgi:hypothetical protein
MTVKLVPGGILNSTGNQFEFDTNGKYISYYRSGISNSEQFVFYLCQSMVGNQSYTITLSGQGSGITEVMLYASHWTGSYALWKYGFMYTDSYDQFSFSDIHTPQSSGSQGAWSISRPSSGQTGYQSNLIITKSAGSYGGGMRGMIRLSGQQIYRLVSIT